MNSKNVYLLAGIVVVFAIIAVVVSNMNRGKIDSEIDKAGVLMPELTAQVSKLNRIIFTEKIDGELVTNTLVKEDDQWLVTTAFNYPARVQMLTELMNTLALAKTVEPKTAKPEFYYRLEVNEPETTEEDISGTRVQMFADEELAFDLIIGKTVLNGNGQYVRFTQEPQSWLMDQEINISAEALALLNRVIGKVRSVDVQRIDIKADGTPIVITRNDVSESFQVQELGEGVVEFPSLLTSAANALNDKQYDQVMPVSDVELPESFSTVNYLLFSGANIQVTGYKTEDDKRLITISVTNTKQPSDDGFDVTAGEVARLNAQWQPWVYEVSRTVFEEFEKNRDDFVKEPETAETE